MLLSSIATMSQSLAADSVAVTVYVPDVDPTFVSCQALSRIQTDGPVTASIVVPIWVNELPWLSATELCAEGVVKLHPAIKAMMELPEAGNAASEVDRLDVPFARVCESWTRAITF